MIDGWVAFCLYGLIVACSVIWGALVTYLFISYQGKRRGRKFP